MHTIRTTVLMLSLWSLCWPSTLMAHGPDVSQLDPVEATVTRMIMYPPHVPLTPFSPHKLRLTERGTIRSLRPIRAKEPGILHMALCPTLRTRHLRNVAISIPTFFKRRM